MKKLNYLKAIIICHGKSEKTICEYIKSNLRLKIEIASDKKGTKSIQINSLLKFLNNKNFGSIENFLKSYEDISSNGEIPDDFKIFIIMDTDDCKANKKKNYINKSMFSNHWAYKYIMPIYNSNNLEDVLAKCDIAVTKKKDYINIFTMNRGEKTAHELDLIHDLTEKLKKCDHTNMEELFLFCLKLEREQRK